LAHALPHHANRENHQRQALNTAVWQMCVMRLQTTRFVVFLLFPVATMQKVLKELVAAFSVVAVVAVPVELLAFSGIALSKTELCAPLKKS